VIAPPILETSSQLGLGDRHWLADVGRREALARRAELQRALGVG
jgi:hypothetical protein